jgi:tetratricopeptide (TPR) repeat protein
MSKDLNEKISVLTKKFEYGNFQDVINESLIILKKNNNDFLWNLLGLSYQNLHQIEKSIDCFENTLKLNPKNFSALNNLGISYKKLRNYHQAEKYLLKALEINSKYINPLVNLGNIKNDTYFFDDAISYYKKALTLNKNLPLIHLNISTIYQSINRITDAKKHLNEAILIDETFTIADQKLTSLEKYQEGNPHIKKMLDKLNNINLNDSQKVYLYFGLNKIYKDLNNYEKSFYYLNAGNKLQRQILRYDIASHQSLSKKIKSIFSKINLDEFKKGNEGENNIFILGMPRSGTTLIEKIVSSHSNVSSISEANFIPEKISKYIGKDFDILKEFLNSNFQLEYNQFIKSFNIKNNIIVDKTLTNFWYLGFIKIFFPKAKIIHTFRNPKDNCLSIYENVFDFPEGWNSDQLELAEYYLIYKDLMKFWNELFKDSIHNVEYEDLILNSEVKIKELISFCELEWEDECLEFYKNDNPIKTVSFNQANKPIYNTSIKKYKLYEKELDVLFSKLI